MEEHYVTSLRALMEVNLKKLNCRNGASLDECCFTQKCIMAFIFPSKFGHGIGGDIIDWIEQWLTDSSRWGGFKLEISFEWGTTRISIRAFIFLNINQ